MSTVELLNQLFEKHKENINPTEIYNEGWLLKCVMEQIKMGKIEHKKLIFPEEAEWYSEALVPTFFRTGEENETDTHADALVGHFEVRKETKRRVNIKRDCSCLYIIEAKMYSNLSKGVKKAPYFNQCARNIACLMKMVYDGIEEDNITKIPEKVGFYVFLPNDHKSINDFNAKMDDKSLIKAVIRVRLKSYITANNSNENYKNEKGLEWLEKNLDEFVDNKIDIKKIFWEDLITEDDKELNDFYRKCKEYNKK